MSKKYPAQRTELFGVYRLYCWGNSCARELRVAFAERKDAEAYIENRIKEKDGTKNRWQIETVKAVMAAWDGI